MVDLPASEDDYESVEVLRGPNLKPLPVAQPLTDTMEPVSYTHLDVYKRQPLLSTMLGSTSSSQ